MAKNKYSNIKVQVSCIPNLEKEVRQTFFDCLTDYSERFKAPVTKEKVNVHICFIEYPDPYEYNMEAGTSHGLTIWHEDNSNKLLIQVRDPFLNNWENNYYVIQGFLTIMCHEFVHACQHLTSRDDIKYPKIPHDKTSDREKYFFDPTEIEARMLEVPYMCMYCGPLL
jgi:hypothetical protein